MRLLRRSLGLALTLLLAACSGQRYDGSAPDNDEEEEELPWEGCLAEGTRVATPEGSRRIEDLRPGDRVLTFDPATQSIGTHPILATRRLESRVRELSSPGAKLRLTPTHPVYDSKSQRFVPMGSFPQDGALLRLDAGWEAPSALRPRALQISAAEPLYAAAETSSRVYDLTVAGDHDFFAEGILVHNKSFEEPGCSEVQAFAFVCPDGVELDQFVGTHALDFFLEDAGKGGPGAGGEGAGGQGAGGQGGQGGGAGGAPEIRLGLNYCNSLYGYDTPENTAWEYYVAPHQLVGLYDGQNLCAAQRVGEAEADDQGRLPVSLTDDLSLGFPADEFTRLCVSRIPGGCSSN